MYCLFVHVCIRACHDLLDMIALCNSALDNVPLLSDTYKVLSKCSQSAHKVLKKCLQNVYKVLTNCLQVRRGKVDEVHAGCSSPQWIPKS